MSGLHDRARPALAQLDQPWDLLVIGGGITGAGIALEAARRGIKTLLVEQRDFAWGTSSRSSKLVHGGLRYLQQGQVHLTRDSVREREQLLRQARGLVEPQSFAFANYPGRKPSRWLLQLGLALYDALAGRRERHYYASDDFLLLAPHIARAGLQGGVCYTDAKTDDARLVLRVLQEARDHGCVTRNYLGVQQLVRSGAGADAQLTGVELVDALDACTQRVSARVVVNATGAWADRLRAQQGAAPKLRPLRGSHLVLPAWRLPVAQAVSLMHPRDGRPVFVFPWEGATLVGTTDVDHRADLQDEAHITEAEVAYLMEVLDCEFAPLQLTRADVIATYAGVRSVVDSGKADPSKEVRDHAVWLENGLLTVTGGKLTTFRLIALDALKHLGALLPAARSGSPDAALFAPAPELPLHCGLNHTQRQRLQGRYGAQARAVLECAQPGECQTITGTETLWLELRWAARCEAVVHLEDLLLRRTRLGLLLRQGGAALLPRIRSICQAELGWSDARWEAQAADYLALWQRNYSLPTAGAITQETRNG